MSESARPILKWAGGKQLLLDRIRRYIPQEYGTYFEPFLGGGALFFDLDPKRAVLGDLNAELINFYSCLRQFPEKLIAIVSRLKNDKDTYNRLRASFPKSALRRAGRFFFLNRTCFNGLYRTNRKGEFNVPFGNNGRPIISRPELLHSAAERLSCATLACGDFEHTCSMAKAGDLIYLDPPYTVAHGNNGFVRYNAAIFEWADQIRLRDMFVELARRGSTVVLSNAAHESIATLYKGFTILKLDRHSLLSTDVLRRTRVQEFLILSEKSHRKHISVPVKQDSLLRLQK